MVYLRSTSKCSLPIPADGPSIESGGGRRAVTLHSSDNTEPNLLRTAQSMDMDTNRSAEADTFHEGAVEQCNAHLLSAHEQNFIPLGGCQKRYKFPPYQIFIRRNSPTLMFNKN